MIDYKQATATLFYALQRFGWDLESYAVRSFACDCRHPDERITEDRYCSKCGTASEVDVPEDSDTFIQLEKSLRLALKGMIDEPPTV